MRIVRRTLVQALLLVATLALAGAAALAQDALDPLAEPTFGSTNLAAGFAPDPFEMELVSGGFVDATEAVDPSCWGYVASVPDYRINWSGQGSDLRIFFVGEGDTTLIVNDPLGNWHCNDDFEDRNPLVELTGAESGQYDIWVGSFDPESVVFGRLFVTEGLLSPLDFGGPFGSLDFSAPANFGDVALGPGFSPDPFSVEVLSGGGVDVLNDLIDTDCTGYATEAPDFSLEWTADGGSLLRILVVAEGDTTLIVNDPFGEWLCNDDAAGFNPMVEFVNPDSGRYDIWIGSFQSDTVIPGTLHITERPVGPDDF